MTDYQGSAVAMTGSDGATTADYTYTPYGDSLSVFNRVGTVATDNPFRYIGGYLDNLEGDNYYHLGARYDRRGASFTQQDPSGEGLATAGVGLAVISASLAVEPASLGFSTVGVVAGSVIALGSLPLFYVAYQEFSDAFS